MSADIGSGRTRLTLWLYRFFRRPSLDPPAGWPSSSGRAAMVREAAPEPPQVGPPITPQLNPRWARDVMRGQTVALLAAGLRGHAYDAVNRQCACLAWYALPEQVGQDAVDAWALHAANMQVPQS